MQNNITGKVIVITGASSGFGEATASLLASQGAKSYWPLAAPIVLMP